MFLCSLSRQTPHRRAADRTRLLHAVLAHDPRGFAGVGVVAALAALASRAVASVCAQAARPAHAERLGLVVEQRGRGTGAAEARSRGRV